MGYLSRKFGNNHHWNVKNGINDTDLTQMKIKVGSTSTRLDIFVVEGNNRWDAIAYGTFDLSKNPQTIADLNSAQVTNFLVKLNNLAQESIDYAPGFDFLKWLTSYDYRYTLLAGDDVFIASLDNPFYGDQIRSGSGNDHFTGYADGIDELGNLNFDSFFGEGGIDTSHYRGQLTEYVLNTHAEIWDARYNVQTIGISVVDSIGSRDGTDWLKTVERLEFSDTMVGLDVGKGENTGEVYRLYLTVLGRNPESDPVGCGFWIDKLDRDILTAEEMVGNFLNSTEFVNRFGGTTNTNEAFVNLMYLNLLGRDGHPDSGFSFWLSVLDNNLASREQVVVGFMESPENVSNAAVIIGDYGTFSTWLGT